MDFYAIQKEVYEIAYKNGWYDTDIKPSFGEFIAGCHLELSEAFQEYRNQSAATKIENELADVVIRIMGYCYRMGFELEKSILRKNEYNRTRPFKHGGKRL